MRHGLAAHTTAARAHSLCSAAANAVAHASAVSNASSSSSATTTTSSSSSSFASQDSHDAIEQQERQSLQAHPPHASTTHTADATARATSTSSSLSLASHAACRCCCCSGTCGGNSATYAASSGHNSSTTSSSSNGDNNNTHVVVLTAQQQQEQQQQQQRQHSCGGGGCSCCDGVAAAVAAFCCHNNNICTSTPSSLLGQPESAMGGTISNGSVATPRSASCADDDSATRRAVAWSCALQEQQPLSLSSSSHYAVVHTSSSPQQQQQQHAAQRARGMSAFDNVDVADDSDARGATADDDGYDDDDEQQQQQRRQQQQLLQHREAQWRAGVVTSAAHSCTTRDDRGSEDVSHRSYKHSSVASNDDEKEAEVGRDACDGATHCPAPLHATATTTTTSSCSYRRAVSPLSVCLSSTLTLCASHSPQHDSAARRGGGNAMTLSCSTSSNSHGGVVAVSGGGGGGDSISGDYSRSCIASSSNSTTTATAAATTAAATTTTTITNNNNNSSMCSSSGGSSSRLSRCRQKMRSLTAPAFDLKPIEDAQDCSSLLADVCNAARCHPLSKITRYLYLGTWRDASDEALLRAHGITYVLNVAKEVDAGPHTMTWQHDGSNGSGNMTAAHGLRTGTCSAAAAAAASATACNGSRTVCATIPMTDCHHQDLTQHFETAFAFIEHARRAGERVLVHCRRGISRSAAIVIAYLMATHQRSYESALAYVMQRRSCVSLNLAFQEHLSEYQPDVRWAHTHGGRTRTHTLCERVDKDDDASSSGGTNNTTSTTTHASPHPRHGHRRCREDGVTSGGGGGGVSSRSSDACTLHMPHDGGSNGSLCSDMSCNSNCNSSDGYEPTAMRTYEVDDDDGCCGGGSGRCAQRTCSATCASPRHKDAMATTPHCGPQQQKQQQPQSLSRSYW